MRSLRTGFMSRARFPTARLRPGPGRRPRREAFQVARTPPVERYPRNAGKPANPDDCRIVEMPAEVVKGIPASIDDGGRSHEIFSSNPGISRLDSAIAENRFHVWPSCHVGAPFANSSRTGRVPVPRKR